MMHAKEIHIRYRQYDSAGELSRPDALLLEEARKATQQAYAPYSRFRVGAAAILPDGQVVTGSNQENASFPAGICAERVLLSAVASLYPGQPILTLAVSYLNGQGASKVPITPCGICRQSLSEYQSRTRQPIRLILGGQEGPVWVIEDAGALLPLAFSSGDMGNSFDA
jgi:cytidine deaminase